MLELFGHPFSSYTWKALIALYENETEFDFRILDERHPENASILHTLSPQGKFPLLVDGDQVIFESSIIIEYLQHRQPGSIELIPTDNSLALDVRALDRFFDCYVMTPMQQFVSEYLGESPTPCTAALDSARAVLQRSYSWLDKRMQDRDWACGSHFSLADCAAAPSLFYADWVCAIETDFEALRAYRAQLLARPSVKRCVDDARPYRHLFPLGAPERD